MAGDKRQRSRSKSESRSPSPTPTTSKSLDRDSPAVKTIPSENAAERRPGKRNQLTVEICKDFSKGRCKRLPSDCKYAHPASSVAIEENKVTVCFDSLRDRCSRGSTCRYYHPSAAMRVSMQEAAGIRPSPFPVAHQVDVTRPSNILLGPQGSPHPLAVLRSPSSVKNMTKPLMEICRDFVHGRCTREADECRYAHHSPTAGEGDYVIVCSDHLRGKCERNFCRYFHAPEHLRSRIRDGAVDPAATLHSAHNNRGMDASHAFPSSFYDQQVLKRMRTGDYAGDPHSWGLAQQSGAPIFHAPSMVGPSLIKLPTPLLQSSTLVPPSRLQSLEVNDEDRVQVCRDFLKNKCARNSSCKYAHPEPQTKVVDNYVTVCRDFQRGKCKRESCRFYHS